MGLKKLLQLIGVVKKDSKKKGHSIIDPLWPGIKKTVIAGPTGLKY